MPPLSHYSVLHHFTKKLYEAFQRTHVQCRLLEAKTRDPAPFLKTLLDDPPDCTLSFNGLLPDEKGNFFCDMVQIPHVTYLVDSPNHYTALTRSPRTVIACVDRTSVGFFHGLGFSKTLFTPHAVESDLSVSPDTKRDYDVVMLASNMDYEAQHASWRKKYPKLLCRVMEEAADKALSDITTPYYQAFVDALDRQVNKSADFDPEQIDFLVILDEIERYLLGKDRTNLLQNITEAKVDVFGSSEGTRGWKKYLDKKRNIVIHDPIPFEQALDIMKHTKILLNSVPSIHEGAHERIFSGIACGALVLSNENPYLRKQFIDGESLAFYLPGHYENANRRVNEYLADQAKREHVVHKGQQVVAKSHTWDHRAAQLIQELPPLLTK